MTGLDLAGVNLQGAYLYRTELGGANLGRATGLTQAQIDIACGGPDTKLPAGLTLPAAWPCRGDD